MTTSSPNEEASEPSQLSAFAQVFPRLFGCILPIAYIIIGAVYLDDCPRQPNIPIYLIVSGTFSLLLSVLPCFPCTQRPTDAVSSPLKTVCMAWNSVTSVFLFCWFITGNVWIYSIYQPNYDKNTTSVDPYCNKTLYLFSFWTTTLVYIMLGLFLPIALCVFLCICLCGRATEADVDV